MPHSDPSDRLLVHVVRMCRRCRARKPLTDFHRTPADFSRICLDCTRHRTSDVERRDNIETCILGRSTAEETAARLGIKVRSLEKWCTTCAPDLWQRLMAIESGRIRQGRIGRAA